MSETRAGFLGTLKSELDDSDDDTGLDPAFETLASLCGAARAAYLEYRLSPEKAANLFKLLRLQASDGAEWTVGPTTGAWYQRAAGAGEWKRAMLPVGLEPVFEVEPTWLTEGIAAYLLSNQADVAEEKARAEDSPGEQAGEFEQGIINPFATPEGPSGGSGYVPARPEVGGEDANWLLEEWSDFDSELETLRQMRAQEQDLALPDNLPPSWNPENDLVDGQAGEIAAREGSEPVDPAWTPSDRDAGLLNPESFYLPPEE